MNPTHLVPMIITNKLDETRSFYLERAGFKVTYDMPHYLQVHYGDGPELAFMDADAPSPFRGDYYQAFDGRGLVISIPTEDPDAKCKDIQAKGTPIASQPSDKPWGWRSFIVTDPNGVALDFFKALEGAPAMPTAQG